MQNDHKNLTKTAPSLRTTSKKPYTKPGLEILGDLRSITLGGSVGMEESGRGFPTTPGYPIKLGIPFPPTPPLPPEY